MRPEAQLLSALKAGYVAPAVQEISLEIETLVGGNTDDFYSCLVCLNVVWQAKSCQGCERMFCGGCITNWLKKNPSCPNCKAEKFVPLNPSLAARRELEKMRFKCSVCKQEYFYNKAGEHQSVCNAPKQACLMKCSPQLLFRGWSQMEEHLLNSCPSLKQICCTCGEARYRYQAHSCVQGLLKKVTQHEQ